MTWEQAQKQAREAQQAAWIIAEEDRELREMTPTHDVTVTAQDLRYGDSIYDRNGFGYCSTTVLGSFRNGNVIYVHTRLGDRKYYAEELIEIAR